MPAKTQWIIRFGKSVRVYYTEYHADQYARALSLNGTQFTIEVQPCQLKKS